MVGACRAAPVYLAEIIARAELAELPESLAGSGTTPPVNAVRDRLRDALRLDEDVGQAVGEAVEQAARERGASKDKDYIRGRRYEMWQQERNT